MEELISTLRAICTEHLVMRRLLREDKQIPNVRQKALLHSYQDAIDSQFRAVFGNDLENLPKEITPAQLLEALSTTNLAD